MVGDSCELIVSIYSRGGWGEGRDRNVIGLVKGIWVSGEVLIVFIIDRL